ncbi:MAG TPA: M48 family metalloprotease [Syntrophorhabdaceae bacterium]|nr:M48 family metalloprotease [Syntrophorhabdaceae bacterium]
MKVPYKTIFTATLILWFACSSVVLAITDDEERKYGKEIYREIVRSAPVNNDPYISLYLNTIKEKLEAKAALPFSVTLTIIDAPMLDAFTTMGGYVYVTTGLIALCDKEEELAGVLAHEFGHIKKRHVAKMMEKQKYINIGMLSTMLLGMLVGAGQTPAAVITSGAAGAQAMSLQFTREDEEEADREGAIIADKTGYGPLGTVEFLKKLRATGTGGDKMLPQYLLTHPYHEARIVALESIWGVNRVVPDWPFFPYLVVRANILHRPPGTSIDDMLANRYLKDKDNPVNNYAVSLIYALKGDSEASVRIAGENGSAFKSLFLGEMLVNARKFREAVEVLKNGTDPIEHFFLAKAYDGLGINDAAISSLKGLTTYGTIFPEIYYRLGMLYGRTGQEAHGYEYLGRYYLATGNLSLARTNLEKAVSRYGINSPEAGELMKLLAEIKRK